MIGAKANKVNEKCAIYNGFTMDCPGETVSIMIKRFQPAMPPPFCIFFKKRSKKWQKRGNHTAMKEARGTELAEVLVSEMLGWGMPPEKMKTAPANGQEGCVRIAFERNPGRCLIVSPCYLFYAEF